MATRVSSPDLFFLLIVALFITHSTFGLETIVGSGIFNQLIMRTARAVFASQLGELELDKAILF